MSRPAPETRGEITRRLWREDPVWAAEQRRKLSEAKRRKMAEDPEFRARLKAHGRWLGKTLGPAGNASRPAGSPARIAANRKVRDRTLAWCHPDYRDSYIFLLKRKGIPAAEARAAIEAEMRRDGVPPPIVLPTGEPLPWSDKRAAEIGSAWLGAACAALAAREARR